MRWRRATASGWLAASTGAFLLLLAIVAVTTTVALGADPGPPFPDPTAGRRVYDQAGVLSPGTIAEAERIIAAIEQRTGSQGVIYTQVKPSATEDSTRQDAAALIDQWGIGRAGFDDGWAIFFNFDESLRHGQVQLYGAPGVQAAYLSNEDRQRIYDDEMLPALKEADFNAAVLIALRAFDRVFTADHANELQAGRQLNAVAGLVGGPLAFIVLAGWAALSWWRKGRDPVYHDDDSVLMPAPPAGLTAATGAVVMDGGSSRRALTTALLDLASRDEIVFRQEDRSFGRDKVGIEVRGGDTDDPRIRLNRRRPTGPAEDWLEKTVREVAGDEDHPSGGRSYLDPDRMPELGTKVATFDEKVEAHAVKEGWFGARPGKVRARWSALGTGEIVTGGILLVLGFSVPASGLVLLGVGVGAAGVVTILFGRQMPARTREGAMIQAMLAAYRRTLDLTFRQARSMIEAVAAANLPWLETPDQGVVWGVALGLQSEVEQVLERTMEDLRDGRVAGTTGAYVPTWYVHAGGDGGGFGGGGSGGSTFSSSPIPNIGGMFAAIGTIGNAPSSSSGGGGFGGGGSGGGGGGAGGGF